MTAKKTTEKKWSKLTERGAKVCVRDLAKVIGQVPGTRPQLEQATL
jgi:hypothetical protein